MEEKKDNYQLQEENTISKVILEENRIKKRKKSLQTQKINTSIPYQ